MKMMEEKPTKGLALEFCRERATPEMLREAKGFAELNLADAIELLALIVFNHAQVLARLEAATAAVDSEQTTPRPN